MGSIIEINDTLQLTKEQGFPQELVLERHLQNPLRADEFAGRYFVFTKKPGPRLYKVPPVRNFLVQNINGKWLYWGHCLIIEQTISSDEAGKNISTSGKFVITKIYSPEFQRITTIQEAPPGMSYF